MHFGRKLNVRRRPRRALMTLLLVPALILAISAVAFAAQGQKTSGVVYAGITHQDGNDLIVAGDINDKLLGKGAIIYLTQPSAGDAGTIHVEASSIIIYTTKGSLTGKGQATQVINDDGSVEVKDGVFNLNKGTGKYKGRSLKGTFAGPQNSNGLYTFSYKATYR